MCQLKTGFLFHQDERINVDRKEEHMNAGERMARILRLVRMVGTAMFVLKWETGRYEQAGENGDSIQGMSGLLDA